MNKPLVRAIACVALCSASAAWAGDTRNVILVIADGVRWQESSRERSHAVRRRAQEKYWDDDSDVRRRKLFPFLWGTVATRGQIYGNQNKGSVARVTNPHWFSYPGYNEMASGQPIRASIRMNTARTRT